MDYGRVLASHAMTEFQMLYMIERFARNIRPTAAERKELRLEHALPVLNELGKWKAVEPKKVIP